MKKEKKNWQSYPMFEWSIIQCVFSEANESRYMFVTEHWIEIYVPLDVRWRGRDCRWNSICISTVLNEIEYFVVVVALVPLPFVSLFSCLFWFCISSSVLILVCVHFGRVILPREWGLLKIQIFGRETVRWHKMNQTYAVNVRQVWLFVLSTLLSVCCYCYCHRKCSNTAHVLKTEQNLKKKKKKNMKRSQKTTTSTEGKHTQSIHLYATPETSLVLMFLLLV